MCDIRHEGKVVIFFNQYPDCWKILLPYYRYAAVHFPARKQPLKNVYVIRLAFSLGALSL